MQDRTIRLERDALMGALGVVERAVQVGDRADKTDGNVRLEADEETQRLTIVACEMAQTVVARSHAQVGAAVNLAVPGRLLIAYVRALPSGGDVELAPLTGGDDTVRSLEVECGAHNSVFPVLPVHSDEDGFDVPNMDEEENGRITATGGLFRTAVQAAVGVARQAKPGSALDSVHLMAGESVLRLAGCDSSQVVLVHVDLNSEWEGSESRTKASLPVAPLADMVRHVTVDEDVEIVLGERRVALRCGAGEFYIQMVVGNYPNVEGLIPSGEPEARAVVSNELFRSSVRAVSVLARQEKDWNPLRLSIEDGQIVLDYTGLWGGGFETLARGAARMAAETTFGAEGGNRRAIVDVGYVTSHAAVVPTDADLHVELRTAAGPMIVRSSFGDDRAGARITYAVMPIRRAGEDSQE